MSAAASRAERRASEPREAELRGAEPRAAEPREAELVEAELRGAEPREAELREAELREAELRGAEPRAAEPRAAAGGTVYRIVWSPGSDRLHGICHCGAEHVAEDPVRMWGWLLAHPDHDGTDGGGAPW